MTTTLEFLDAMQAAGIGVPRELQADGKLHRFRGDGDKPGNQNCFYILHLDGDRPAGAFGSWRLGIRETWRAGSQRQSMAPAEMERTRRIIQAAREKAESERQDAQQAAAQYAARLWHDSEPADPSHSYLAGKRVQPHGLRQRGATLLVPLSDLDGRLSNLQRISADGTKRFLKAGRVTGLASHLGDLTDPPRLLICEGWSTAATLFEATGQPALAAMNAGNLRPVALAARERWPQAEIVIAADNDVKTPGNPGVTAATNAAAAIGARLAVPEFPPGCDGSDYNDLHRVSPFSDVPGVQLVAPEAELVVEAEPEIGAAEASDQLRATLRRLVRQGLDYLPEPGKPVPHAAVRAQAGLGKTSAALEVLAEMAMGETVHYYLGTHDLAEEVAERAEGLGLKTRVLKGRSRNIGNGERMCAKFETAEAIAAAGLPVWQSLCEDMSLAGSGVPFRCEHFHSCPYVAQFQANDGRLILLTHEWLALPRTKLPAAAVNIIDERFYDTLVRGGKLALDRITRVVSGLDLAAVELREGERPLDPVAHMATARKVRAAIEAGEHPREHGLAADDLREAARFEHKLSRPQWISPAMPTAQQKRLAGEYAAGREARALGGFYGILAGTYERATLTQRVHLVRNVKTHGGELQDLVFTKWAHPVQLHSMAPAIVIDASADKTIINQVLPLAEFIEINTPVQARVIQVFDTVCSRRKMTTSATAIARVVALARREAAAGKRVLLVSYKPTIEAMGEVEGVDCSWFGALRGVDRFKDHDVAIIAGREQVRAVVAEAIARALFGDDDEPLNLPGDYVLGRRRFVSRGGVARFGPVQVHPDERCQAIVEQSRERESEQAVARLRLVHRTVPATVYLLSNLPTKIPVDEFVAWPALLPDKAEQAAQASQGIELLSASELARCYPERWPSRGAAEQYLRRRETTYESSNKSYRENVGSFPAVVSYRSEGSGKRGPAPKARIPAGMTKAEGEAALAAVVGKLTLIAWDGVELAGTGAETLGQKIA